MVGWYNGAIVNLDLELEGSIDTVYGSTRFEYPLEHYKKYAVKVNSSGILLVAPEF